MKKTKIDEQTEILLNEFKEMYEPKNKIIEDIILKQQHELMKGQIPQVVLQHVVGAIYQVVFLDKITIGDKAGKILKKMDKLSRSNGYFLNFFYRL